MLLKNASGFLYQSRIGVRWDMLWKCGQVAWPAGTPLLLALSARSVRL
jgi:hypothetical protein